MEVILRNNIVTKANENIDNYKSPISYENLPIYRNTNLSIYKPLFQDDFELEELTIKFAVNS